MLHKPPFLLPRFTLLLAALFLVALATPDVLAARYVYQPKADLKVETQTAPTVTQGGQLRFDIRIRNTGPNTAEDLRLHIDLPDTALFIVSSSPCDDAPGVLDCKLGTLKNGKTRHFTLVLQAPETVTTLELKTHVSSALPDPRPHNNQASSRIMVQADMPEQPLYLHYTPVVLNLESPLPCPSCG